MGWWATRPRPVPSVERLEAATPPIAAVPASYASNVQAGQDAERLFDAWWERYRGPIYAHLWRLTGNVEVARDLCQETFAVAWQEIAKVGAYDDPQRWLYRVATNKARDLHRRGKAAATTLPLDDGDGHGPAGDDFTARLAQREVVLRALRALTVDMRAGLLLREVERLPLDEVARILGKTPGAAKRFLSRARQRFIACYLREEGRA